MRKKNIIYIFSMVFLMGFCAAVSAGVVTDSTTDALVAGYDIAGANIEVWDINRGVGTPHYYMKVTVDMKTGGKTPGIVAIELDVDNDNNTGGHVSMTGIFPPCAGGPVLKTQAGYDILITMILREQDPDVSTSLCEGCIDNDTVSCGNTRYPGEWWASAMALGDLSPECDRSRITMRLLPPTDTVNGDLCFIIDYTRLTDRVNDIFDLIPPPPGYDRFDYTAAQNPANLRYQIDTWYDYPVNPVIDDFIEDALSCANVTDVVPNAGRAAATVIANDKGPRAEDVNNDGTVSVFDLIRLKGDYNTTGLMKKCNK